MKLYRRHLSFTIVLVSLTVLVCPAAAQTIWNAANMTFTKANYADWTLPANQDCITSSVCLTRGDIEGLFNAKSESSYNYPLSPSGTEWAFQGLNGNPSSAGAITAANYTGLKFTNFSDALETNVGNYIVNRPGVLHIISGNIYLNITFTSWTHGNEGTSAGGGFSYVRATGTSPTPSPVPAPPALILACTGLGAAALYELKRRLARR